MTKKKNPVEHALEGAVSRALRDNLTPLQRTADELQHAYADLVAACGSSKPSNALPALLRAQSAAAALAAGLSVLSNFVAVAWNPRDPLPGENETSAHDDSAVAVAEPAEEVAESAPETVEAHPEPELEWVDEPRDDSDLAEKAAEEASSEQASIDTLSNAEAELAAAILPEEAAVAETQAFDIAALPSEMQDLHRRANRVAKVAMQDIKLLRPKDVRLGREHKDVCTRMRGDLDKARKEYDRRFRAIEGHPVDYFYHWLVEILAEGDAETLGEYPYPSPVLRH
ncbi:MAG: hypothetical protein ABSD87_07640 [Candidatus Acidiferrales bacterium]